ncbi:MAG: hypothetical protein ACHQ50_02400 [Fimbriimonadales bacterium]
MVQHQVHQKFKVFTGGSIKELSDRVRAYTASGSVAAKSIGIEFLEQGKQLLLSLGYATGQPGYPVTLRETTAGPLPENDEAGTLGRALEKAAVGAGDVICHELYVDAESVVHMVFMVRN